MVLSIFKSNKLTTKCSRMEHGAKKLLPGTTIKIREQSLAIVSFKTKE
jgi:hypothetical protein